MSDTKLKDLKDLLLEDYRHYGEWLHRNEESGEKRVNLYITLLAVIPTAIIAIAEKNDLLVYENRNVQIIFCMVLFALFFFGYFTFLRLIKRNSVTDEMKFAIDNIRQQFLDLYDANSYLTYRILPKASNPMFTREKMTANDGKSVKYHPDKDDLVWEMRDKEDVLKSEAQSPRRWVSLIYLVLLLNSLVFAALLFILVNRYFPESISRKYFLLLGFFVTGIFQLRVIKKREAKIERKIDQLRYTHAGGVIYKRSLSASGSSAAEIKYLVITSLSKDNRNNSFTVLPKGHIEYQEEISRAALREVFEETGVIARIERSIGNLEHSFTEAEINKRIHVRMYLMECVIQGASKEGRNIEWLSFDDAYNKLSFQVYKRILFQANSYLISKNWLKE